MRQGRHTLLPSTKCMRLTPAQPWRVWLGSGDVGGRHLHPPPPGRRGERRRLVRTPLAGFLLAGAGRAAPAPERGASARVEHKAAVRWLALLCSAEVPWQACSSTLNCSGRRGVSEQARMPRRRPSPDRRPSGSTAAACSRVRSAGREHAQGQVTGLHGRALASGAERARQRGGRRSGPCRRRSRLLSSGGCGGSWAIWADGRWTWTPRAWTPSPQRCRSESPASALRLCLRSEHPSPELKQRGGRTSELAAHVLPGVNAAVHFGRGGLCVLSRCSVRCSACPLHSSSGAQAGRARWPARPTQVH